MNLDYARLATGEWFVEATLWDGREMFYFSAINKDRAAASWAAVKGCTDSIKRWHA